MAPLTAAAAVLAIAVALVLVRVIQNGGAVPVQRPSAPPAGVPPYYVALTRESDFPG
jgi:hypothetical protein